MAIDRPTARPSTAACGLEDWFAVQRDQAVTINAVVFAHGRVFHDGGWWDTAKGKPRIQILAAADGVVGGRGRAGKLSPDRRHDSSADPRRQVFRACGFQPPQAVAIRIVGAPACGDNPGQSFASCAELQGFQVAGSKDPAAILPH